MLALEQRFEFSPGDMLKVGVGACGWERVPAEGIEQFLLTILYVKGYKF